MAGNFQNQGIQGNYAYNRYSNYSTNYNAGGGIGKAPGRQSPKPFLAAVFIVAAVAVVVAALFLRFHPQEEGQEELPEVSGEQLILTSPADSDQQVEVRRLIDYDWAVMLNTPLEDKNAVKAIPYLATLELETAVMQYKLLNVSERHVGSETLQMLEEGKGLRNILDNLAVLEEAYYRLGLPSGIIHAERLRHLSRRLEIYGPPIGEVQDSETRLFVQEHLGFAVGTYEAWYTLISIRYDSLIKNIEKTKDLKSVLTVEQYLEGNSQRREVLAR